MFGTIQQTFIYILILCFLQYVILASIRLLHVWVNCHEFDYPKLSLFDKLRQHCGYNVSDLNSNTKSKVKHYCSNVGRFNLSIYYT